MGYSYYKDGVDAKMVRKTNNLFLLDHDNVCF